MHRLSDDVHNISTPPRSRLEGSILNQSICWFVCCQTCELDILKVSEQIWCQLAQLIHVARVETDNLRGQEFKGQGYTRQKIAAVDILAMCCQVSSSFSVENSISDICCFRGVILSPCSKFLTLVSLNSSYYLQYQRKPNSRWRSVLYGGCCDCVASSSEDDGAIYPLCSLCLRRKPLPHVSSLVFSTLFTLCRSVRLPLPLGSATTQCRNVGLPLV